MFFGLHDRPLRLTLATNQPTMAGMEDYLTIADAARRLDRSRTLVHRWIEQGRIPVIRIAGRPFIRTVDCKLPKFRRPGPKKA